MANPRVAWGIDIGNRALKAIKLVRQGSGVQIDDVDVIEHESILSNAGDNRDALIQTALAVFTSKHNLKGAAAAVGVSGQQSFARFIKLPPVEEKKIPEIVRFEAIQQIPFPLDEVEWSYQLFRDESSPDVEVGIFAMRKELVDQHLAFFTGAGLNVQAVQMNPLADYNALFYDEKIQGATMVIDLGAENADLIIAEGETVWMRSIPIGGNHFTEALVRDFKLRFERAEELKRTTATSPHGRRILQAMRPVFADLVSEIQRSIGFYSSTHRDSRIAKVIALGGTFKLPGLQKYLQQNLGLEVVKLDSLGQTPPSDAKVAATLNEGLLSSVSAYGLALQALGDAKIASSLLPKAIQKERIWKEKTKWFATAAAMVVAGVGVSFVVAQGQEASYGAGSQERRNVDDALSKAKQYDSQYASKETAGADDRKKMDEAKRLAEYRDIWPALYSEIDAALPQPKSVTARAVDGTAGVKPIVPAPTSAAAPAGGPASKPAAGPASNPAAVAKFGTRSERNEITLEDLEVEYDPKIGALVAKSGKDTFVLPDSVFNLRVGKRDPAALVGIRERHGGQSGGGNYGASQVYRPQVGGVAPPRVLPPVYSGVDARQGLPGVALPSQAPGVGPVTPDTGAPAVPDKRGFLVTLHLTTPNAGGISYIDQALVKKLLANEAGRQKIIDAYRAAQTGTGEKTPPPIITYSIPRVTITSNIQLKDDQLRQQALINRAKSAIERKARRTPAGLNGGVGAVGVDGRVLLPPNARVGAPVGPSLAPGSPGAPGFPGRSPSFQQNDPNAVSKEDLAKLLVDPITGEDIQNDYTITVLVAVVLDPVSATDPPATPPG